MPKRSLLRLECLEARRLLATDLDGLILAGETRTLTADDNPHVLVGDLRILPGGALNIQPGVEISAIVDVFQIVVEGAMLIDGATLSGQPRILVRENGNLIARDTFFDTENTFHPDIYLPINSKADFTNSIFGEQHSLVFETEDLSIIGSSFQSSTPITTVPDNANLWTNADLGNDFESPATITLKGPLNGQATLNAIPNVVGYIFENVSIPANASLSLSEILVMGELTIQDSGFLSSVNSTFQPNGVSVPGIVHFEPGSIGDVASTDFKVRDFLNFGEVSLFDNDFTETQSIRNDPDTLTALNGNDTNNTFAESATIRLVGEFDSELLQIDDSSDVQSYWLGERLIRSDQRIEVSSNVVLILKDVELAGTISVDGAQLGGSSTFRGVRILDRGLLEFANGARSHQLQRIEVLSGGTLRYLDSTLEQSRITVESGGHLDLIRSDVAALHPFLSEEISLTILNSNFEWDAERWMPSSTSVASRIECNTIDGEPFEWDPITQQLTKNTPIVDCEFADSAAPQIRVINVTDDEVLQLNVSSLDFSSLNASSPAVSKTIRLLNEGNSPIYIGQPFTSGAGVSVSEITIYSIEPGDFTEFDITLESDTSTTIIETDLHVAIVGHERITVPITGLLVGTPNSSDRWQNNPAFDVDDNAAITPVDALRIINELTDRAFSDPNTGELISAPNEPPFFPDVNGDGFVSPIDALLVIEKLPNRTPRQASDRLEQTEPAESRMNANMVPNEAVRRPLFRAARRNRM